MVTMASESNSVETTARKSCLVTGGAQGIGAAVCLALAKDGFNVAVADLAIKKEEAELVIKVIQSQVPDCKLIFVGCDVSQREEVFAAVQAAHDAFGTFDLIVNNAGIATIKSILEITEVDSAKSWKVNVNGVLWGIQAAAKKFIELGHPNGKIVNACSIAGHRESVALAIYGATKFAVRSLTQTSARELAQYNIKINAYCPGIVNTPMWDYIDAKIAELTNVPKGVPTETYLSTIALGRMEEPEDITGLVCFLASDKSNYITGQSIIVDGGIIFR